MSENATNYIERSRPVESFKGGGAPKLKLLGGDDGGFGGSGGRFFDKDGQTVEGEKYHGDFFNFARLSVELGGGEHVVSPYAENVFVRSSIKAFASGLNRLKFGLWDGDPTEIDAQPVGSDNELMKLIANPNRRQTENQLWSASVTSTKLSGESYWFLATNSGRPVKGLKRTGMLTEPPTQIIQANGSKVTIKKGPDGWPESYRYRVGNGATTDSIEFPWYAVIPFIDYNPDDETRGLGDAESAIRPIDIQHQIMRYLDATLRNGGAPSGMLIFEEALAPAELQRRQEEVDDDINIDNAGRIKVIDRRAKFIPSGFTPKDFEYEKLWAGMTSAILTAMGTPEPVVGVFENATYENVRTAFLEFWRGTNGVLALGTTISDVITNKLLPRLAMVWPSTKGLVAHFDHSNIEVLQEDFIAELTLAREISGSGIGMSFNEALGMLGTKLGLIDAGNKHWVRQGVTDLDSGELFGTPPKTSEDTKKAQVGRLMDALEKLQNEQEAK